MTIVETLARRVPHGLKPPLRALLRYLLLKGNPIGDLRIRVRQDKLLRENYSPSVGRLIIYLTPGDDIVNGGILSLASIYEETAKLQRIHGAQVIMCTIPGDPPLLRYTRFHNQNYIYRFSQALAYFQNLQGLMIHVGEYCVGQFLRNMSGKDYSRLGQTKDLHINVMIQNIKLLSPAGYIQQLKRLGRVTCTTAHERYSNLETRNRLGIPLHKLSVFVSPEQYDRRQYVEKEELMIVSPDKHPSKREILGLIAARFPKLRIQLIMNLTYEEFRKTILRAKWALTFGEGLDGYFVETVFSGGIAFSAYNSTFFTEDFRSLRTVYDSYETMMKKICLDMEGLDNEVAYAQYQSEQHSLCCKYYDHREYIKNLESFYRGEYTYE
jgi:hypothetical protein